jgi:hypothetical protein
LMAARGRKSSSSITSLTLMVSLMVAFPSADCGHILPHRPAEFYAVLRTMTPFQIDCELLHKRGKRLRDWAAVRRVSWQKRGAAG